MRETRTKRPEANAIAFGPYLRVVPIVHHRVAYAQLVRQASVDPDWIPDTIAVELSEGFREAVLEGLALGEGPLWAARGFERARRALPKSRVTDFRASPAMVEAVKGTILAARERVADALDAAADFDRAAWLRDPYAGFEPIVFLFADPELEPKCSGHNVASPDRRHIYSLGFYEGEFEAKGLAHIRPTMGRVWLTPPENPPDELARMHWIDAECGDRLPPAVDCDWLERPVTGWAQTVVELGLSVAREHVIVVAPPDPSVTALVHECATKAGKAVLWVDPEELDPEALMRVRRNEYICDPSDEFELPDPRFEVVSLHSGDAIIEAVRWAQESGIELAFVDREVSESHALEDLKTRPTVPIHDDSVLALEGLEDHYQKLAATAEATRIPEIDGPRERFMAAHLRRLIDARKKTFFVCGMAHWSIIRKLLAQDAPPLDLEIEARRDEPATVVCGGLLSVGSRGGDLPRVVEEFARAWRSGEGSGFHLAPVVANLLDRARRRLVDGGEDFTRVLAFDRFLHQLSGREGFASPSLAQIWSASDACLSRSGRRAVMREALAMRAGCPEGVPRLVEIGTQKSLIRRSLVSRWGALDWFYDRETEELVGHGVFDGSGDHQGPSTLPEWDGFIRGMHARAVSGCTTPRRVSAPPRTLLNGTLDLKRTLRARVRDPRAIRVFERRPLPSNDLDLFEQCEPVIWDFEIGPWHAWERLFADDWVGGPVIGLAITTEKRQDSFGLSGFAVFSPSLSVDDKARTRRWLERSPGRVPSSKDVFGARARVGKDGCTPTQALVDLGLRFCVKSLVLVAQKPPSDAMLEGAREQGKRIVHIPLASVDEETIRHMRRMPVSSSDSD